MYLCYFCMKSLLSRIEPVQPFHQTKTLITPNNILFIDFFFFQLEEFNLHFSILTRLASEWSSRWENGLHVIFTWYRIIVHKWKILIFFFEQNNPIFSLWQRKSWIDHLYLTIHYRLRYHNVSVYHIFIQNVILQQVG